MASAGDEMEPIYDSKGIVGVRLPDGTERLIRIYRIEGRRENLQRIHFRFYNPVVDRVGDGEYTLEVNNCKGGEA